jgi:protocatechuate 3,4-dioxygenase beta subunit
MKHLRLLLLLPLCTTLSSYSQTDTLTLLQKAKEELSKPGVGVSTVLSSPAYLSLHPLTAFRDLIASHSKAEIVTIVPDNEPGPRIIVKGMVRGTDGKPVPDAEVYLYQTDARGWYAADRPHVSGNEGDRRHARWFGYVRTDKNGGFELHTIKPNGYPQSDLPAHIHIEIHTKGNTDAIISELLFDDDPRLKGNTRDRAMEEGFIIAKPLTAPAPFSQIFTYEIKTHRG